MTKTRQAEYRAKQEARKQLGLDAIAFLDTHWNVLALHLEPDDRARLSDILNRATALQADPNA